VKTFKPRIDLLPEPQRLLWPDLVRVSRNFVLYGGTAVALRLGYRTSLDFDLFSSEVLDADALYRTIPFLVNSTPLQRESDALTVLVERHGSVKVSFFGGIQIGCIDPPELTDDGVLQVASLRDLLGTKLKVLLQRVEAKDYRDIAALLRSGISLGEGLGAAQELYAGQFPPCEALKALVYFQGGDLDSLESESKTYLTALVRAFKGPIPAVGKTSAHSLTAE
jgi:nucleotidyltransferase AbiEii toxin of type IV toxin-antitoxin system